MPKDKIIGMVSNSSMFYETAKILDNAIRSAHKANNPKLMALYSVPHIVNKSFATEMAIKAILAKEETSYSNIHRLDTLFDLLSDSIKGAVMTALKIKYGDIDIDNQIEKIGNAFVDWRYFQEKSNAIDYGFFNTFAEVICQSCYQLCKE